MNPLAGIPSPNVQPVGVFDEGRTCCCDDGALERLRGLITGGMGQWEASRLLWGGPLHAAGRTERGLEATSSPALGPNAIAVTTRWFARSNRGTT